MNMKEMDIGRLFRERLEKTEETPEQDLWSKIAANKQLRRYNKLRLIQRTAIYSIVAITAITAIYLAVQSLQPAKNTVPSPPLENEQVVPLQDTLSNENQMPMIPEEIDDNSVAPSQSIPENRMPTENVSVKHEINQLPAFSTEKVLPTQSGKTNAPQDETVVRKEEPKKGKQAEVKEEKITEVRPLEKMSPSEESFTFEPNEEEVVPKEELPQVKLYVPDAFTPNGDAINDLFLVYASEEIFDFEILITDINGRRLFHSRNIQMGWDGEAYGAKVPHGSYIYVITFKDKYGKKRVEKGQLILVR
ncbi:MAG: gliding motility-associated C-terminal domain-containing protein [Bacteroidales bacterium]